MSSKKKKNHPWEGFADNPLAYEYGSGLKDNVKKGKEIEIDHNADTIRDLDNADTEVLSVSVDERLSRNSKGKEEIQVEAIAAPVMPVKPIPPADLKNAARDLRNAGVELDMYFAAAKMSLDIAAAESKKDPVKVGIVKKLDNLFLILQREPQQAKVVINNVDQLQGSVKKSDTFFEKKKENKIYKSLSSLFTNIKNAARAVVKLYEADGVFNKLSGKKSRLAELVNPAAVMEMMEEIRPVIKAQSAPAATGARGSHTAAKKEVSVSAPRLNRSSTSSLFGSQNISRSMHPIERVGVILFDYKSDERSPMLKMTLLMELKDKLKKEGGNSQVVCDLCDAICAELRKMRAPESGGGVYKHTDQYVIGEIQVVMGNLDESSKKALMSTKSYKTYENDAANIANEAPPSPPKLK
jgi:hypothetical protein